MRLIDDSGAELEAEFDLEPTGSGVDIILHPRSGNDRQGRQRNPAYNSTLEHLLRSLASIGATLSDVLVDSAVAQRLATPDRRVDLPYPVTLSPAVDTADLRVRITEGQRTVASSVTEGRGGNKHKRLRISVDLRATGISAATLATTLGTIVPAKSRDVRAGTPYKQAKPNPRVRPGDVFSVDSSKRERALAGHARIQNELADYLTTIGHEPRSPTSTEPDFDIAWCQGDAVVVAEVKTLSGTDPVQQLRLGLGQVLDYRHSLEHIHGKAIAVLAVEYEPPTPWMQICARAGVLVSWPPLWPQIRDVIPAAAVCR